MFRIYLIVLFCCFAIPFILTQFRKWILLPIRIHGKQSIARKPDFEPTTAEQLTPEMREFLGRLIFQFQALGFEVISNVRSTGAVPGVRSSVTSLLVNRTTGDMANVIMVSAENTRAMVFSIGSHFEDGQQIITGFNRGIGVDRRKPWVDAVVFSWVRDPATLYEIHRRRVERAGRANHPRRYPAPGEELAWQYDEWERSMDWSIRSGMRYHDPVTNLMWLTWRGAFAMTWKLTEPVKSWRMRRRDGRARRLWNELEMGQYQPATISVPAPPAATSAIPVAPVRIASSAPIESASEISRQAPAQSTRGAPLAYQAELAQGEIRKEYVDGALVIRMGTETASQYLARRWASLLFLAMGIAFMSYAAWRIWILHYLRWRVFGVSFYIGLMRGPALFFLFWFIVVLFDVAKLWRGMQRSRGTIVITATHEGIRFANAPGKLRNGQLARDDIQGFRIRLVEARLRRSLVVLEARLREERKGIPLLIGRDPAALLALRSPIAQAMGIELPEPPMTHAAVVA